MKRVIVLREKYGDLLLDASTDEALHKSALSVVKARFGGPRSPYLSDPRQPVPPDISRENVKRILNKELYQAAVMVWDSYDREMRNYQDAVDENEWIKTCLKTKNGKMAVQILESRSRYEYEGFEIRDVLTKYPE